MFAWLINFFKKLFGLSTPKVEVEAEEEYKTPDYTIDDKGNPDSFVPGEKVTIPIFKPLPEGTPYPRQAGPDVYWIERGVSDVSVGPWNSAEINQHATDEEKLHNLQNYSGGFRQSEELVRLQMAARIVELTQED